MKFDVVEGHGLSSRSVYAARTVVTSARSFRLRRVVPDAPKLLADDDVEWANVWRGLKTARKTRFIDALAAASVDIAGLKTQAQMIQAREQHSDVDTPPLSRDDERFGSNCLGDAIERSARRPDP